MDVRILVTPRLILQPLSQNDAESYYELCADPVVMRTIGSGLPLDEDTAKAELAEFIAAAVRDQFGMYAVIERRSSRMIGRCGIRVNAFGNVLEIVLERMSWGKGYAAEAAAEVLRHAFYDLDLNALIALPQPDDERAKSIARKLGMRPAGLVVRDNEHIVKYEVNAPPRRESRSAPTELSRMMTAFFK
jgi:RimJ/RimL family protein N-acetyltransferase